MKSEKCLVCCPGNAWQLQYIHHSGEQKWKRLLVVLPIFSSGGYYFIQRVSISCFHPLIVVMPEGSKGNINEHERAPADLVRQETERGLASHVLEMLRIPSFSSSVSHFDLLENILDMKQCPLFWYMGFVFPQTILYVSIWASWITPSLHCTFSKGL